MTAVGIAGYGAHADDEALSERDGDAVHSQFMQGVDLVRGFRCLVQQAGDERHPVADPIPQQPLRLRPTSRSVPSHPGCQTWRQAAVNRPGYAGG